MYIASFRIENYKSFRATDLNLTPGFNVIVGQNNVGKTALVEALTLAAGPKPHRSLRSLPSSTAPLQGNSRVDASLVMSRAELIDLLRGFQPAFWVPNPEGSSTADTIQQFRQALQNDPHCLQCTFQNGGLTAAYLETFGSYSNVGTCAYVRIVDAEGNVDLAQGGVSGLALDNRFDYQLAGRMKNHIYAFRAERFNVGVYRFGPTTLLRTDAANLPEVLDNLQGRNPERFARLNGFVQTIFPVVRRVTVRPQPGDALEIIVWTVDPATEREDLAIPLAESGTGIGQVLAMLYVVVTADRPQVILIDEPQSFLHPGAARKLIEILKQHSQHQFIITTHSLTALTAAEPDTLLRLRLDEGETIIDLLDVTEANDLRLVLADVGARLSDVFGADNILWVEGRTEELSFPRILQRLTEQPLLGTAVVGVLHTADFDARRSEATIELYKRLSAGRGLLPPAVGFIFDREGRSEQDRADLERRGNVFFLPRRMYENYLMNPAAIAAVTERIDGFRAPPLTATEIEAWLDNHRWDGRYFDPLPAEHTTGAWLSNVHGAKLLADLFSQLSEQRVSYDKVRHGVALVDWLLEHAPDDLQEVAQLIEQALGHGGA